MNRKVTKPRKNQEPRWETHVYLSEADYSKLKAVAEQESRSITMQIQHFIRVGLSNSSGIRKS